MEENEPGSAGDRNLGVAGEAEDLPGNDSEQEEETVVNEEDDDG
jgi:hypothetical protein